MNKLLLEKKIINKELKMQILGLRHSKFKIHNEITVALIGYKVGILKKFQVSFPLSVSSFIWTLDLLFKISTPNFK